MTHASSVRAALLAAATAFLLPAVLVETAHAQPSPTDPKEKAKQAYAQGAKNYDLGNFEKAVENFKKAYEEWPDGAFLFNIAQSYRQLNDCRNALFFYKRFLSVKKDATADQKKEVEGHIKVLDECVKNQDAIRNRQPDGTDAPDGIDTTGGGTTGGDTTGGGTTGGGTTGGGTTGGGTTGGDTTGGGTTGGGTTGGGDDRVAGGGDGGGGGEGDDGEEPDVVETTGQPKLVALHASFGGAMVGAGDLSIPVQVSLGITAGYPIPVNDKLVLDVGAGFAFTPVPWSSGGMDGSATMTNVFANAGGTYAVAPKIAVRGELGAGLLLFGGLADGNPFAVVEGGALAMPLIRAGLTGEYTISKNLAAAVTPVAFSFSPAKDNMMANITSLTRLEFTVGLGYRM